MVAGGAAAAEAKDLCISLIAGGAPGTLTIQGYKAAAKGKCRTFSGTAGYGLFGQTYYIVSGTTCTSDDDDTTYFAWTETSISDTSVRHARATYAKPVSSPMDMFMVSNDNTSVSLTNGTAAECSSPVP